MKDPFSQILINWVEGVICLQQGLQAENEHRRPCFERAAKMMLPSFKALYGWRCDGGNRLHASPGSASMDGSVAYYTAKALWLLHIHEGGNSSRDDAANVREMNRLREALEVAFDRLESVRQTHPRDVAINAIYNLCVALVLAMRNSCISEQRFGDIDIRQKFDHLNQYEGISRHFRTCVGIVGPAIQSFIINADISDEDEITMPRYIYVESTERLDELRLFEEDLMLICNSFNRDNGKELLISYFKGEKLGVAG